ncbi:MAG: RNA methyltransferase [Parachlamydia sp.]|nr:RNA methyltransferase [Parachlamydia sp.]
MNITSLQHPAIKHLVKLRHNRDYREEHGSAVIEGNKMVAEVCQHIAPKSLFVLDQSLIPSGLKSGPIVTVSEEVLTKITGTPSPEGIVAEVPMPAQASLQGKKRLIALDGVSDPGNLGTLLRTALALGFEGAFLFHDCCDPCNDKALRAAKGATFRLPIRNGSWEELTAFADQGGLSLYAADLNGIPASEARFPQSLILVLGSEAHGLSLSAREGCQKITIPQHGAVDSLNVAVAGGILMYVMAYEKR